MQTEKVENVYRLHEDFRRKLQHEIKTYVTSYHKSNIGQGLENLKVIICEDMLIIRAKGNLTKAEKFIKKNPQYCETVKTFRMQLIEQLSLEYIPYFEQLLSAHVVQHAIQFDPEQDIAIHLIVFDRVLSD